MILITGVTGNIGSELVPLLLAGGRPLRVVTRDERKVAHLDPRVERVVGDLGDRATVERAMRGVDKLFVVSVLFDDGSADRLLIDEAKRAGVRHVVKISSLGTSAGATRGIGGRHREKEQYVEASGLAFTFLRPGIFMSNALQWTETIKSQATVYTPTAHGRIAPRDIAAVAAAALTETGHVGQAYELTGPELLSAYDEVTILSRVLGKPIACVDVPPEVAAERVRKSGAPDWLADGLVELWNARRSGKAAVRTDEVARVTGRAPQTFEQWCEAHRSAFV